MTDDAAKPDETGTKPPAQLPPASAPAPTESLETVPDSHATPDAPAPIPPAEDAPIPRAQPASPPPYAQTYTPPAPVTVHHGNNGLAVLLGVVSVVALLGAGYSYYLTHETATALAARLDALDQRVAALDQRTDSLEKRPVAVPADLQPLTQRLTTLENRQLPDLSQAGQREIAQLAGRIDQMLARQDQLGQQEQADVGKLASQLSAQDAKTTSQFGTQDAKLAAQDTRIATTAQASTAATGQADAVNARAQRLAAMQAASGALAAGRPLGPIPSAPPALAQFADKPPPTEASLRLAYPDAARAAHEAGMPAKEATPVWSRMLARMQSSLTIRQGDHVVVGDPASDILAHAQSQLDAGDLAGAVATLNELTGPAFTAMAPWKARAQSLLDARAALLTLARG